MTTPRKNTYTPRRSGRRQRVGLKPAREIAVLREHPASQRWLDVLLPAIPASARTEGEVFAREGMVMRADFRAGVIEGAVQPALPEPGTPAASPAPRVQLPGARPGALYAKSSGDCAVTIRLPAYDETQWQRTAESLAGDSSAAAALLAGELPADLDDALTRHGSPLAPRTLEGVSMTCSCHAESCPHIAALLYLAADRLCDEPALALVLRGSSAEELVERVRHARAAAARRSAPPPPAPSASDNDGLDLADFALDEFWRSGPELDDLAHQPPSHHAPHALLRRLGPSPLGGAFPLVGLLASAYDTIKAHAEKLRDDAAEKDD